MVGRISGLICRILGGRIQRLTLAATIEHMSYPAGTRLLAVFAADRKPYPAEVVSVERDQITVTFLGYGNTATLPAAEVSDLPALLSGWSEDIDPSSGHIFYTRLADGSSQWDRPSIKKAAKVAVAARRFGAAFKQTSDGGEADSAPRASAARRRIEEARNGGGSIVRAGASANASAGAPDYQGAVGARRNRAAEDKMAAAQASDGFGGPPAPERQRNPGPTSGPGGARQRAGGGSTNRAPRQQAQLAAADEEKKKLRQLAAALDERATRAMPRVAPIRLANGNDARMVGSFASRKPRRKPRPQSDLYCAPEPTYEGLMAQMSFGGGCCPGC